MQTVSKKKKFELLYTLLKQAKYYYNRNKKILYLQLPV